MVPAAVYLLRGAHFQDMNLENMFAALLSGTGPWVCAGIACLMIAGTLEEKYIRREIEALKTLLKADKESEGGTAGAKAAAEVQTGSKTAAEVQAGVDGAARGQGSLMHDKVSHPGKSAVDTKGRRIVILQALVIAAAVFFIVAGILNGSMNDVLIKAINICTECIGLG